MRRGRRKALYRRERASLKGPHEEAEIQCQALRRGKNLAFSEDTCLEKERVRSKVTPRKVEVGLKRRSIPIRQVHCDQVFLLKPAPFCNLFAGLESTTSLPFFFNSFQTLTLFLLILHAAPAVILYKTLFLYCPVTDSEQIALWRLLFSTTSCPGPWE